MYRKKSYGEAFDIFEKLVKNHYKPGLSNYYLGEIKYYKKKYADAIVYYKKSIAVNDEASYIPTLLLHTGISFERLNDIDNAKRFYSVLIEKFSKSKQSKFAEKYMKRLNK